MSSSAISMYHLKPIVALPEQIALPKVMYKLPKILDSDEPTKCSIAENIGRQVSLPEYNNLEDKQMRILKQLCELKEHVEYLCVAVRLADVNKIPKFDLLPVTVKNPVHAEIIVNANPISPPYFILALQRIWKDTNFNVEIYHHSTVSNVKTKSFEEKLLANKNSNVHIVDLKLIWKDVNNVQLVTKVYDYPLEGEANVLRYLTRLIESYNYESLKSLTEANTIDSILDLCLRLSYEEPRYVKAIIAKLAKYLQDESWFLNSTSPSIVDVAVWSVIKHMGEDKVLPRMKKWYDLCEETFLLT